MDLLSKPIRLIEFFAGYGSQAMAFKRIGVPIEHHFVCEFEKNAVQSYNSVHNTNFPPIDIRDVKGKDLNITETDKYNYILTYSFPCGLPGTKVKTENGYKNIEDVVVGDKVLTHTNTYHEVEKTMTRISPNYNKIKVLGYPELQLTDNHPMYVLRDGKIEWVKVKDLTTKDKVCYNVNTKSIPTKCDDNILWLLGRYAADGHINKYTHNSVNFAIGNKKEEEFLDHIPLEMKGKFKRFQKACADYRIADADFQDLCAEIGSGATNKCVPQWILDLPIEQAKCFLDGYFSGDGHKRNDREIKIQMFCTTSKELFLGIQTLIAKIYGVVCSCYLRRDIRKTTFNDTYNGQFSISGNTVVQERIGNQIFTPIRNIEHIEEETPVYNFQVAVDNSYTCENIVVHNCTDLSVAGKMLGMKKGSETRSGLLWEVERILSELKYNKKPLPQILMMENVPQVIGKKNKPDFDLWCKFLEGLGYHNYGKVLNAADYGVPQHRERYYMFSFLDNVEYTFPDAIPLDHYMDALLEPVVADKYYISSEKANNLVDKLIMDGKIDKLNNSDKDDECMKGGGANPMPNESEQN